MNSRDDASPAPTNAAARDVPAWSYTASDRRALGLLLGVALLIALAYNTVIMPGFGPDENRHYAFIKLLVNEHRLPFLNPDGSEYLGADSLHPPLYYLCLIPFYLMGRAISANAAWHVTRLGSALFCLGALPLLYAVARRCAPTRVAFLATITVGWLPIWGMTAGTVNNDGGAFFAFSLLLWLLAVKFPGDRTLRAALLFGVCLGLGTLMKATVLLCGGVSYLIYLWVQDGPNWLSQNWRRLGAVLAMTLLIAGWWPIRSLMIYGTWTPLPAPMPSPFLPPRSMGAMVMMLHPNFPYLFGIANWSLFFTTWSQKDWLLLGPQPDATRDGIRLGIYLAFAAWVFLGLLGNVKTGLKWILPKLKGRFKIWLSKFVSPPTAPTTEDPGARIAKLAAPTAFAITWITVLQVAMFYHWGWAEGGRYFIPALFGLTLFTSLGCSHLLGRAFRFLIPAMAVLVLGTNAVAIFWLVTYLNPTFGPK